mgnify:FL=1
MRDLLNLLDMLAESTGLAGRKPGDVFRNPAGEEIVFNDLKFFPETGGKYEPEQLEQVVQGLEQDLPEIQWQNSKSARSGGVAIATFNTPDGEIYIGRYLESIKPSATDNKIPNQVGDYRFAGKAALKSQAGLSPQDLLTNKIDLTIPDIMTQLAETLGTDNPLYAVAHKIAIGEGLPITFKAPTDISFSAFRDYFCEILQPMALQTGLFVGNAGEAAEAFLGGTYQDTLISFDTSKTAGLSDSIMTNSEGKFVKVSSKGGKGATASAKNLVDSINELQQTPNGTKLLKKYSDTINMLRDVQAAGQNGAPLVLGVRYNIIDHDDAETIKALRQQPPMSLKNLPKSLSPTLRKLALERGTNTPENVNMYYHLMAAVAHKAAEKVNDKTNFSEAAATILNNGALVQVYTKAKEGKDTWTLTNFDTVYPGDSIKGVYLSASKTYYSTGIKGNFTFKIDKGTGKPKEEDNTEVDPNDNNEIEPNLRDVAADIVDTKRKREPKPEEGGGVGRTKRR